MTSLIELGWMSAFPSFHCYPLYVMIPEKEKSTFKRKMVKECGIRSHSPFWCFVALQSGSAVVVWGSAILCLCISFLFTFPRFARHPLWAGSTLPELTSAWRCQDLNPCPEGHSLVSSTCLPLVFFLFGKKYEFETALY